VQRKGKSARRNLPADVIFLLIQRALIRLGDVAAVLARHVTLFLADLVILVMEFGGLLLAQRTVFHIVVYSPVLVSQSVIYLGTTWMILLPLGLSKGIAGQCPKSHGSRSYEQNPALRSEHNNLLYDLY
jgi:hypothetical protein